MVGIQARRLILIVVSDGDAPPPPRLTVDIGSGFQVYGSPAKHQNAAIWLDNLLEFEYQ
jgi:hypothetical protein